MARISGRDFIGTRIRFYRTIDAAIFNGWVDSFFGTKITVRAGVGRAVAIGDEFVCEAFGLKSQASFTAKLESVGTFDLMQDGNMDMIAGSNGRIINAQSTTFELRVISSIRFLAPKERAHLKVTGLTAKINYRGRCFDAVVADVSEGGIGLTVREVWEPGTRVDLSVDTSVGVVKASGDVRYCRAETDGNMFRIGVRFNSLGRIDAPRWERVLKTA